MIYSYPALFIHSDNLEDGYSVYIPDLDGGTTFGNSFDDAMNMAIDLLAGLLVEMRDDNEDFPKPSKINEIDVNKILEPIEETFNPQKDFLTYISVDYEKYEKEVFNKLIKKTLSIPFFVDKKAKKNKLNMSKFLTNALITYFKENNL